MTTLSVSAQPMDVDAAGGAARGTKEQWSAEMAEAGIAHLPHAWYRQTARNATWNVRAVGERLAGALVAYGINVAMGYLFMIGSDEIGLWNQPNSPQYDGWNMPMIGDLILTTFFLTFITAVLNAFAIREQVKRGLLVPVDDHVLDYGWWRCMPVKRNNLFVRSALLVVWAWALLMVPLIILLQILCSTDNLHGSGSQCSLSKLQYNVYVKGPWAFGVAWIIFPFILGMSLNVRTIHKDDLDKFVHHQKLRWDKQKESHSQSSHMLKTTVPHVRTNQYDDEEAQRHVVSANKIASPMPVSEDVRQKARDSARSPISPPKGYSPTLPAEPSAALPVDEPLMLDTVQRYHSK